MAREVNLYLQDIWESLLAIENYLKGLSISDFQENQQVQDAVVRRLEIMGEAAKNVDEDFRNLHSDIPWKKIAGLRDVLIHEYFGVNIDRVWEVVRKDFPPLRGNLQKIIDARKK